MAAEPQSEARTIYFHEPDSVGEMREGSSTRRNDVVLTPSPFSTAGKAYRRPVEAENVLTHEVLFFDSGSDAARAVGINAGSMSSIIQKGWVRNDFRFRYTRKGTFRARNKKTWVFRKGRWQLASPQTADCTKLEPTPFARRCRQVHPPCHRNTRHLQEQKRSEVEKQEHETAGSDRAARSRSLEADAGRYGSGRHDQDGNYVTLTLLTEGGQEDYVHFLPKGVREMVPKEGGVLAAKPAARRAAFVARRVWAKSVQDSVVLACDLEERKHERWKRLGCQRSRSEGALRRRVEFARGGRLQGAWGGSADSGNTQLTQNSDTGERQIKRSRHESDTFESGFPGCSDGSWTSRARDMHRIFAVGDVVSRCSFFWPSWQLGASDACRKLLFPSRADDSGDCKRGRRL